MKLTMLAASILMLVGCAQTTRVTPPAPASGGVTLRADLEHCHRAGGTIRPVGRMQTLQCVIAYADAGRRCTSGEDCAGDCRVERGVDVAPGQPVAGFCQPTSDRFGCSTKVEKGLAQSTICID